jgi:membrane protease YdiL (CAAX protease family)
MNSSTLAQPAGELSRPVTWSHRAVSAPFLPHARVSVRTAIWSVLLAVGLVGPFAISAAFFPFSPALLQKLDATALRPGHVFLMSVLVGPLIEELVYRGLFLQLGRRYLPLWVAILLPSVVFAATHIGPLGWAYLAAFPMSCLFSWLVVRSGSIYSSLLCHCSFNLISGFAIIPIFGLVEKSRAQAAGVPLNPLTDLFPFWWTALSLALIVAAFVMISRDNPPHREPAATAA